MVTGDVQRNADTLRARETISAALDLGIQAWRTVPSARNRFMDAVASLGQLADENERLRQQRDEAFAMEDQWMGERDLAEFEAKVARQQLDEARQQRDTLTQALREISKRGAVFDAKGTHSKWVCDVARAALAVVREGE